MDAETRRQFEEYWADREVDTLRETLISVLLEYMDADRSDDVYVGALKAEITYLRRRLRSLED